MDEKDSFKKICVVPNRKDFVDTIVSLIRNQQEKPILVSKSYVMKHLLRVRQRYNRIVLSTEKGFCHKLLKVIQEFPRLDQIRPSDPCIPRRISNFNDYMPALHGVVNAIQVIRKIAQDFRRLLGKRDVCDSLDNVCDSLDQLKTLKVAAIGCMFTAAMRCIHSLHYLEKVRQYMTESNLGDENAACTLIKAQKDCTVPRAFDVHAAADFVHPRVVSWLWGLEREYGWRLKDDQLDSATLSHNPEDQLVATTSSTSTSSREAVVN